MDSKVNYTLVGAFVLILGALLFIIALWMSASTDDKSYKLYVAVFKESVSGLNEQASVKYNGVDVGYVKSVSLDLKNPKHVDVVLAIEDQVPVTTNTLASLQVKGITGIAYIGLTSKNEMAKGKPLRKTPGERYPQIEVKPSLLFRLDAAIGDATKSLNDVSTGIKNLLSTKNQQAIEQILLNSTRFSNVMADNAGRLNAIIDKVDISMTEVNSSTQRLPELINNANRAMTSISNMSVGINQAADQLTVAVSGINSEAVPAVVVTMQELQNLVTQLKLLTQELEQNPSALLRGRQPQPLGPGE